MFIYLIIAGVLLVLQGLTAFGWVSFIPHFTISSLHSNLYFGGLGVIVSRLGLIVGIISLALSLMIILDKKKGTQFFKADWFSYLMCIAIGLTCIVTFF